jgi:hypothetical protein
MSGVIDDIDKMDESNKFSELVFKVDELWKAVQAIGGEVYDLQQWRSKQVALETSTGGLMNDIDDIIPTDHHTYLIVAEKDSEFDRSLAWFLEQSKEQAIAGLVFKNFLKGHPYPSSVYLSEEVDTLF